MKLIYQHDRCVLLHGDAANIGQVLSENTIDAIVADPPAGIDFMQKGWDSDKGGRDLWIAWLRDIMKEAFKVLKPGAHCLLWALPRTAHWTATAVEDAGFEIRDVVTALNGQGFPKSLNVSKAIDARAGATREVIGSNPNHRAVSGVDYEGVYAGENTGAPEITAPATDEAKQWNGWGTALKPAAEFWVLARKPLEGTVANNVLKYGTGALNIDGCRIGVQGGDDIFAKNPHTKGGFGHAGAAVYGTSKGAETYDPQQGRWPAHLVLVHAEDCTDDVCGEHCPARMLDEQSGATGAHSAVTGDEPSCAVETGAVYALRKRVASGPVHDRAGGPSRFFYQAKAPRSEKDDGLDHLPQRGGGEATGRKEGSAGTKNPRAGAGRTGGARNIHPTVKSVALMRWLIRLTTPPGGTVLDLFAGSGTTGVAAFAEGMDFVGVEQGGENNQYLPILVGRIDHAIRNTTGGSSV